MNHGLRYSKHLLKFNNNFRKVLIVTEQNKAVILKYASGPSCRWVSAKQGSLCHRSETMSDNIGPLGWKLEVHSLQNDFTR